MIWPGKAALRAAVHATIAAAMAFAFANPAWAQKTKAADASPTCSTCHAGVARSYAIAPMRHAIEPHGADPVLASHPNLNAQIGGYSYKVETKDGQSTYTVSDGTDSLTLPVRWNFGQHAQTWVLEKDGHYYESLVSFFPRVNGLAITPGDQRITPHNVTEAMGRQLPIWEIRTCFNCHGSEVAEGQKLDPSHVAPGVNCERCHAGAQQHMADAAKDNFKTIPPSLKRLNSEQISDFCGQCHRTFDTVLRNKWHGPAFVRIQPYRLELSRCFIGTDPRISCVACHDPHQPLNQNAAVYDSKCLACHADSHGAAPTAAVKTCPVAKSNCTRCHMPKVELPGGNAQFTDHYIRVVRPGEPYPE